jgi:hypothetical protein
MISGEAGSWAGARPEADTRRIIEEKREMRIIEGTGGGSVTVRMAAVVRWHGAPVLGVAGRIAPRAVMDFKPKEFAA